MRKLLLCVIVATALLGACTRSLSPEEQAQVQALRTDLESTKREITETEAQNSQYGSGLIKAVIVLRLEILKTNAALIQQRIHSIESGAKITIATAATKADPERAKNLELELTKQELKVTEADAKASAYSGGLIGVMVLMGAATERNSLALLRQQYLIAKHGLALPQQLPSTPPIAAQDNKPTPKKAAPSPSQSSPELSEQILDVSISRKQFAKQDYQDYIFFDIIFSAKGLDKPARAIKGLMIFTDLFGEQKFALKWTLDKPVSPGSTYTEKGSGFNYNQFIDTHQWIRNTDKENMKAKFRVDNILYEDGTTRNFD